MGKTKTTAKVVQLLAKKVEKAEVQAAPPTPEQRYAHAKQALAKIAKSIKTRDLKLVEPKDRLSNKNHWGAYPSLQLEVLSGKDAGDPDGSIRHLAQVITVFVRRSYSNDPIDFVISTHVRREYERYMEPHMRARRSFSATHPKIAEKIEKRINAVANAILEAKARHDEAEEKTARRRAKLAKIETRFKKFLSAAGAIRVAPEYSNTYALPNGLRIENIEYHDDQTPSGGVDFRVTFPRHALAVNDEALSLLEALARIVTPFPTPKLDDALDE